MAGIATIHKEESFLCLSRCCGGHCQAQVRHEVDAVLVNSHSLLFSSSRESAKTSYESSWENPTTYSATKMVHSWTSPSQTSRSSMEFSSPAMRTASRSSKQETPSSARNTQSLSTIAPTTSAPMPSSGS